MNDYRPLARFDAQLRMLAWVIVLLALVCCAFIFWPLSLLALPVVLYSVSKKAVRVREARVQAGHDRVAAIARIWR